jgi:hypothetical protein
MNKFAKAMCMTAVVALAFTSCKKNDQSVQSFKLNGVTEQFVEVNEEGGDFEKAYLDGSNKVQFEQGDAMMVFNLNTTSPHSSVYTLGADNVWSTTGYMNPITDGNYYAFYPAGNVVSQDLINGFRATFQLKDTQYYRVDNSGNVMMPKDALYMAAKDETATNLNNAFFDFKNICGMLSMKFYSPSGKKITSIEIKDNKFNIVGNVSLKIDKIDPTYLTTLFNNYSDDEAYQNTLANYLNGATNPDNIGYTVTNSSNVVTLKCVEEGEEGIALGKTKAKATRFLVVMRPLALLEGMTITIHFSNAEDVIINSTKDNRITPNIIRNMTAYNVG